MAYPTGSGSEILFRGTVNAQSDSETAFRWDKTNPTTGTSSYTVPALHIITILLITFVNTADSDEVIYMKMLDGSNDIQLLQKYPLGFSQTFVFSDRIVLVGGDAIKVNFGSAANVDIYYSFIDQDWS